jgi:tetratricopeptide (TPR) repeat protein
MDLAQAQFLARQFPATRETLEKLLVKDPRNVAALKLKADTQYLSGEDQAAEQTLQTAIEIDPAHEEAVYALGRIYYQQSRYDAAIRQFQQVLKLNPKSYKAYDNLGLAYEGLNENSRAIQYYLKALELVHKDHPEYDWAYGNLANLMLKLGDYRKAFDLAAEAAKRNPSSPRNFFLGGKALFKLEKLDLVEKWLRGSMDLDPLYPEPRYLLAQVLRKQGRIDEAHGELKRFQEAAAGTPRVRR